MDFFRYRHPRLENYWKRAQVILLIVNSILIPLFIGLSWEATQTLDTFRVACSPYFLSDPAKENMTVPLLFNRFNASILFDNPTLLSLHLFWSLQLNFNSSVVDNGWMSADIGWGKHWAKMQFVFQEPFQEERLSIVSISFLEIESVSSFFVQDRHQLTTLPWTDSVTVPNRMSLGNFTANRLANMLQRAFIQDHNPNNWVGYPICSQLPGVREKQLNALLSLIKLHLCQQNPRIDLATLSITRVADFVCTLHDAVNVKGLSDRLRSNTRASFRNQPDSFPGLTPSLWPIRLIPLHLHTYLFRSVRGSRHLSLQCRERLALRGRSHPGIPLNGLHQSARIASTSASHWLNILETELINFASFESRRKRRC